MKNRSIKEILFYTSLIFMMVLSLNLAIVDCAGIDMPFSRIALFTFIITAVMSVIVMFPITILTAFIPSAGWLCYRYYMDPETIKLYIIKTKEFLSWLYWYIAGYSYFEEGYSLVFLILYTLLAALVVTLIVYSGKGGFVLILLGTAALSFFWFIYVEKARRYLVLFLFAAMMLYSYQVYKKRLKEWRAADSCIEPAVGYNWMFFSAIIVSASLLLSLALPLKIGPARWPWLNDKVVSLFPFIAEWRNDSLESFSYGFNSRFSLNSTGYINRKLGGELLLDDSILITVKTKERDTIYLRGTVKDKYSENSWYKSERSYKEYNPGDPMPLPYGEDINTFERVLEIKHDKLLTSTIFAPYSIYRVQHSSKRIYADEDSEVYTSKMTMKDESYTVTSSSPYININRLRQAKAESLKSNELKVYTSIAPDISERVRTLAQEITGKHNNNYDKAKAIEEYLRQNYKYTPKPPKLPQGAEFTDHFLFEGKEGYCTYFATAMSVLLRAADVPVRYVEGFIARYEGTGTRAVRGTNAHAWVEVYFDYYGWVTFEPTPQYPEIEFAATPDGTGTMDSADVKDTINANIDLSNIARHRRDLEDREDLAIGTEYLDGNNRRFGIGNIVLFIILTLLIIRLIFMYMVWIMKEVSLGRIEGRRFAMCYLENIIWYLRHAGCEMSEEETLREFLKRVKHKYEESFSDIPNVTLILERIRYGESELSFEDRQLLEIFRKKVKQLAVKNAGFVKLFVRLYILGS